MESKKYHLQEQEIPDGFQLFEERLEVSGVKFRKDDASAFASRNDDIWLEFERDEENKYDKNAIKVIGCGKETLRTVRYFIGYVPKEVSKLIIEGGFWGQVRPRLLKTYVGSSGYVEILFQILGPVGKKYVFRQTREIKGGHYTENVDRVNQLIQDKQYDDAKDLLLRLIDQIEEEARHKKHGVAPWYYEQLANIYRKEKHLQSEVEILERFEKQPKSPGALVKKLTDRLAAAKALRDKQK